MTTCSYNSIPRPTQKWPPVLEPTWIWTFTSESGIMSLEDNVAYELLDWYVFLDHLLVSHNPDVWNLL